MCNWSVYAHINKINGKMYIGITKRKAEERLANLAYEHGMKHGETTGNLRKWVDSQYFYNETANNIRLYGDKAFIFSDYKLITVLQIPHNLVKFVKRREEKNGYKSGR